MKAKILNRVYSIVEFEDKRPVGKPKDNLIISGHSDHIEQTIEIYKLLGKDTKAMTVMHECIHCILDQVGFPKDNDNEELIDALATGIVSLIRENKELIKKIVE